MNEGGENVITDLPEIRNNESRLFLLSIVL